MPGYEHSEFYKWNSGVYKMLENGNRLFYKAKGNRWKSGQGHWLLQRRRDSLFIFLIISELCGHN
jgi:hypothetical protein